MAMNASVSAIQDMEKTLADTVRNLDTLSEKISTNFRPSADLVIILASNAGRFSENILF